MATMPGTPVLRGKCGKTRTPQAPWLLAYLQSQRETLSQRDKGERCRIGHEMASSGLHRYTHSICICTPHTPSYCTHKEPFSTVGSPGREIQYPPVLREAWCSLGLVCAEILMGYELGRLPSLLLTRGT